MYQTIFSLYIASNNQVAVKEQSNVAPKVAPKSVMKVPPQKTDAKIAESKKVDLNCKYCNTFFTYTAPNIAALRSHLKTLHQAELAKESDAFRNEIFGYNNSDTKNVGPTPAAQKQVDNGQNKSKTQVDPPRVNPKIEKGTESTSDEKSNKIKQIFQNNPQPMAAVNIKQEINR